MSTSEVRIPEQAASSNSATAARTSITCRMAEQQRRDAELCKGDALVRSGWIYAYDAEDCSSAGAVQELTDGRCRGRRESTLALSCAFGAPDQFVSFRG